MENWGNGKKVFHFPRFPKKVLTNNGMKCYYSTIPLFHHSWLEEKEWLAGDSLLSSIFRNSDTLNYLTLIASTQLPETMYGRRKGERGLAWGIQPFIHSYNFSCTISREYFPPKNTTNCVLTTMTILYIK
jgi:hypothetical protein